MKIFSSTTFDTIYNWKRLGNDAFQSSKTRTERIQCSRSARKESRIRGPPPLPPSIVPESLFDRSDGERRVYKVIRESYSEGRGSLVDRWEEEEVKPKGIRRGQHRGANEMERRSCPRGEEGEGAGGGGDGRRSCMQIPSVHLRGILAGSVQD